MKSTIPEIGKRINIGRVKINYEFNNNNLMINNKIKYNNNETKIVEFYYKPIFMALFSGHDPLHHGQMNMNKK